MNSWLLSLGELITAAPVIFSLIAIEGLLSVDNVLIIAARVKHLPDAERLRARKYAIMGAYGFRLLCLLFASILIEHEWVKVLGGGYLIYLMCQHLGVGEAGESSQQQQSDSRQGSGFTAAVVSLLVADAAFSIDNIVAAVALSPKLWVVVLGVTLGMVSMFFVAGTFSKLVDRFPILEKLAYVLVGYVGLQIFAEYFFHLHVSELQKFGTIAGILVGGLLYDRATFLHPLLSPIFRWLAEVMDNLAELVNTLFKPVVSLVQTIAGVFRRG